MKTRKHIKHRKQRTRKLKTSSEKTLSIPDLRKAFESIEAYARSKPSVKDFQKRWIKIFGKPISSRAAEEYIEFMSKQRKRSQKGGEAPLNYEMRPGQFTTPDGAYQAYISKGFFVPEPANVSCNGSQAGGMINPANAAAAFIAHPYSSQNPPTYMQQAMGVFNGREYNISSDITKSSPNYAPVGTGLYPHLVTPLSNT
jgi:hypothetical protein